MLLLMIEVRPPLIKVCCSAYKGETINLAARKSCFFFGFWVVFFGGGGGGESIRHLA